MNCRVLLLAGALLAVGAGSAAAQAISSFGTARSYACYRAAEAGGDDRAALTDCTFALDYETLPVSARAATHVNRGVLYLRRRNADAALADFQEAQRLQPKLPEAMVNQGAALILKGAYSEAIALLTAGLDAGPRDPHEAYYNRALAREQTDDLLGAYRDLQAALEIKPDWPDAQREIARFSVTPR